MNVSRRRLVAPSRSEASADRSAGCVQIYDQFIGPRKVVLLEPTRFPKADGEALPARGNRRSSERSSEYFDRWRSRRIERRPARSRKSLKISAHRSLPKPRN